ncbi:MAG: hypothetical protein GY797_36075, partial [Deltaproteobacteria bacterium]|nr:hypothetical protein [Deltaproteobacteria bacterium]
LHRQNVVAIPDRMGGEFDAIAAEIPKIKVPKNEAKHISIDQVLKYRVKDKPERPFENLAIAKIQVTMLNMEVALISKMVASHKLKSNKMLMIDGSLQFSNVSDKLAIFQHVIGVSKSFNPNLRGLLKKSNKQIGSYLTDLEFGERTPVFVYEIEGNNRRNRNMKIGAWYMRIRPKNKVKRPLDGVIKIEKIATTKTQQQDGFDTDVINEISRSIILERNVTCYGNDKRWASHLYPIYLTELFLKNTFVSDTFFLNIF